MNTHAMILNPAPDEAFFAHVSQSPTTQWPQHFAQAPIGKWLEKVRCAPPGGLINNCLKGGKTLLIEGITIPGGVTNLHRIIQIALDNRPDLDVNKPDQAGVPPVWHAVTSHNNELLRVLTARGAQVARVKIGKEPILMATINRYLSGDEIQGPKPNTRRADTLEFYGKCINILKNAGCSLEEKSCVGYTPLWHAVRANHLGLTQALLDMGAVAYLDPNNTKKNEAFKLVQQKMVSARP